MVSPVARDVTEPNIHELLAQIVTHPLFLLVGGLLLILMVGSYLGSRR